MKIFKDVIKEIRHEIDKMLMFDVMLNSVLVFLISYFALSFFNVAWYSYVITVVYFLAASFVKLNQNKIYIIESKCQELNEKLRTASDNLYMDNPVINELHSEVIKDLKNVEESTFFNEKETYIKAFVIIVLCFLAILFAPTYMKWNIVHALNVSEEETTASEAEAGEGGESNYDAGAGGEITTGTARLGGDIYGTESIAKLGEEEIELKIRAAGYEINIRDIKDVEEKEFMDSYPREVFAVSAEAYEENIPKEQQELVKNYFQALTAS